MSISKEPSPTRVPGLVSVIIPAFNAELSLARCIDHALGQTYSSLEIIVVNDGSEDGTEKIAREYGDRIRYVSQENRGETAARNHGFEMARGEFITFIDHDDYWHEEFAEKTVSFLKNHPEAVAVSVARRSYSALREVHVRPQFLESPLTEKMEPRVLDSFFDFWIEHVHICCGSAMLRGSLFDKAGGQREDLVLSGDLEYWAYLATFGSWGFIPEILLTTDGTQIRKGGNYYRKFRNRYARVVTVDQWQSRILPRIGSKDKHSFEKLRGRIATWYTFADIFVGRDARAKQCAASYRKDLTGPYGRLWRLGLAMGWLSWKPMCLVVRLRTWLQYRFAEKRLVGV